MSTSYERLKQLGFLRGFKNFKDKIKTRRGSEKTCPKFYTLNEC
jgi:hypothetical protein